MTIDPSGHYGDPVGEAFSHTSQKAAQFISMVGAAYEIAARRKQILAAKKAARTEQQLRMAEEQEKAFRAAARARWAPAFNAQWQAQADLVEAGRVWNAAAAFAESDPEAAAALRKAEERMRRLHPYAMATYDRLRDAGVRPLEAMRDALYLFAREPHARPARPAAPRPEVELGGPGAPAVPGAGQAPGNDAPEPASGPDPEQIALQRGHQIAAQLQDRALAERGSRLSPDELAVALEATTSLPAGVITRLARALEEENAAARAGGTTATRHETATVGIATVGTAHAPAARSTAQLAAENFPHTAAEGIQAAVKGSLRQPGTSQSRSADAQKTPRIRRIQ